MKLIKVRYLVLAGIALILFLVFFFLSTFVKNYIISHSEELIGRKIALNELHFDYLRMAVRLRGFVLYEANKIDSFVSFDEFYVNYNPWALVKKEISVSQISLVNPRIFVSQNKEHFNFDDLIPKDTLATDEAKDVSDTTSMRFTIENIELVKGLIIYEDLTVKNHIELNDLNIKIPLISWNSNQSDMGINFRVGETGEVQVSALVDNKNKKYDITLNTKTISIEPAKDYVTDFADISELKGFLSSNINIKGDMEEVTNLSVSGQVALDSLSVKDGQDERLISADRIETNITSFNMADSLLKISLVQITRPRINFVLDKDITNFEKVMLPFLKADSLAKNNSSVTSDSTTQAAFAYVIDTLRIVDGDIMFSDNTLNRPFSYRLSDLDVTMTGLTQDATKVPVSFSVTTNKDGNISGEVLLNMVQPDIFDLKMQIKKLGLLSFSPYSEYFIASPITQGWFNYDMSIKMTPKHMTNMNKIRIDELEFGKKTKDSTAVKVPIKLALYIIKDRNDVIAFDLPVEGDPTDPKFSYSKIVWKALLNFLVKTATAPFKMLAGLVSTSPEDIEKLPFDYGQDSLGAKQTKILTDIAGIMQKKPELIFKFMQFTDLTKEKEFLAVQKIKHDYVVDSLGVEADSLSIASMLKNTSLSDENFLSYLRTRSPQVDSLGVTVVCNQLSDPEEINQKMRTLIFKRNNMVKDFLINKQNIPAENFEVTATDFKNVPEELRFPHFKIEVSVQ